MADKISSLLALMEYMKRAEKHSNQIKGKK